VYLVLEQFKFVLECDSLILTTGCSSWHLMAKNSNDSRIRIVGLHNVDLRYKRIANILKLSYSTGFGHTEIFQDRFQLEQAPQGSFKEVESSSAAEAGFK